jgi:lactase-phlorizin hydrolase
MYTSQLVFNQAPQPNAACSYQNDEDIFSNQSASWNSSGSYWLKFTPFGIRGMLNWIKNNYGNLKPIIITENGWSDRSGTLDDVQRVEFYKEYITNVQLGKTIKRASLSEM